MRRKWEKKAGMLMLMAALTCGTGMRIETTAYAKESIGNGVILSEDQVEMGEGGYITFKATLAPGFDASRLYCVVENQDVVSAVPMGVIDNEAEFMLQCKGTGNTVVAVAHYDNPAIVGYLQVRTSPVVMEIPSKLGTNKDNYCVLEKYEFVPYDFTYMDFQDYQSTLKLTYKCDSYQDEGYKKWGCYAYFYDAEGNILEKKHLYCASLAKGRTYQSEFHVPVKAVRFRIEGTGEYK